MWRARSDDDDRPSRGGARPNGGDRDDAGQSSGVWPGDAPGDDPRSELTGRKIRRIESGPPGGGDRGRSDRTDRAGAGGGQTLARRPGPGAAAGQRGRHEARTGGGAGAAPSNGGPNPGATDSSGRSPRESNGGAAADRTDTDRRDRRAGRRATTASDRGPAGSTRQVGRSQRGDGDGRKADRSAAGGRQGRVAGDTAAGRSRTGERQVRGRDASTTDRGTGRRARVAGEAIDGDPGSTAGRERAAQRRRSSTRGAAAASSSGRAERNDGPTSSEPRPGRHIGRPIGQPDDDAIDLDALAGTGLPPLRQPTGEVPRVGANGTGRRQRSGVRGTNGSGWPSDDRAATAGVFAADAGYDDFDSAVPSALSAGAATELLSGRRSVDARLDGTATMAGGLGAASAGRRAASGGGDPFPSWSPPGSDDATTVRASASRGRATTASRSSRSLGSPRVDDPRRSGLDQPGSGGRGGGGQRLQETEIKLANRQKQPVKPKEPNRLLLGLALALVVLAGAAVAWFLTRDDGTDTDAAESDVAEEVAADEVVAEEAPATPPVETTVPEEPLLEVPELTLVDVPPGPLDPNITYSIDLVGEQPGSLLQVIVDGTPQGEPAEVLPDLILPSGRHTLQVSITTVDQVDLSTPVEVYVLGQAPSDGYIANLASVDIVTEGWDEAIRRFDGFREAGHDSVQLLPITNGYWNIFIGDLGDVEATTAYCESFGLAVPDDCFPRLFDSADYQGPTTDGSTAADDGTETGADGEPTDEDGAMTDESEAGTATSTTTGG